MFDAISSFWLWQLLGRLHPLVVHFPIGLLVAAFFLELLTLRGRRQGLREGIVWLVRLGSASAVLAASLGWLLAANEAVSGVLVGYHQWLGVATAALSVGAAVLLERGLRGETASLLAYRSILALSVVCLVAAGHLGAGLTHGSDYLASVLPWNQPERAEDEVSEDLLVQLTGVKTTAGLEASDLDRLNIQVRRIFAHHCYECHSSDKEEAELRLDSEAAVMSGGESGPVLEPGNVGESEIVRRIRLPADHEDAMPEEGDRLSNDQIALIELWIDEGAHWSDDEFEVFPEAPLELSMPVVPDGPGDHPVDRFVNAHFVEHGESWPEPAGDATFIRRAYLDLVGLLPDPDRVEEFVAEPGPDKRIRLVDSLLSRDELYAQHWLTFWNDLLRNDYTGTGYITGGREQITDWLYEAVLTNQPYDAMVRSLVNPGEETDGFIKGIEWRGAVNASQTTEMQAAQNVSQAFLGLNLKCASCHDSFVSNWTLDEAYGFANVFADSVLQIYRCDVPTGRTAEPSFLYPQLGRIDGSLPVLSRLENLADILVRPENGRLYRTIVNRIWAQMMGRGIVEPLDEMDAPPWNRELLDWLAADLIEHDYDLKHLIRTIATSRTYGLRSVGLESAGDVLAEEFEFRGPLRRRLTAEQFADALSQIVAPVYASVAFDPDDRQVPADWIWFPARQNDRNILPEPGTYHFRHRFTLPDTPLAAADLLVTADHEYRIYVNERLVGEGSDWREVGRYEAASHLKPGANLIAIEAENEGRVPNPAGILLSLRITFENGAEKTVATFGGVRGLEGSEASSERDRDEGLRDSDERVWKTTDGSPGDGWRSEGFDDREWAAARSLGSHADNRYWGRLLAFSHEWDEEGVTFARASLVERDEFLKALGRPSRENVVTDRDDEATLLQALELTNGEFMNRLLSRGAEDWYERYDGDPDAIIRNLYREAFGREPTRSEETAALQALGDDPEREVVADLLWAVVVTPEFQLVY